MQRKQPRKDQRDLNRKRKRNAIRLWHLRSRAMATIKRMSPARLIKSRAESENRSVALCLLSLASGSSFRHRSLELQARLLEMQDHGSHAPWVLESILYDVTHWLEELPSNGDPLLPLPPRLERTELAATSFFLTESTLWTSSHPRDSPPPPFLSTQETLQCFLGCPKSLPSTKSST